MTDLDLGLRIELRKAHVLVADPPWPFGDKLPGPGRGAEKHYSVMTIDDLCAFPLPPLYDDALLVLWRVSSMVEEAYRVCRAWGFTPKSELVWVKQTKGVAGAFDVPPSVDEYGLPQGAKVHFGMGRTVRASHETAILAHRGRYKPTSRSVRSVFFAPTGVHSEKPDAFYDIVEQLDEDGPYTELFARRTRPGWQHLGHEVGKLDEVQS